MTLAILSIDTMAASKSVSKSDKSSSSYEDSHDIDIHDTETVQPTYRVTLYDGAERLKNRPLIFGEDGLFDDNQEICEYAHIRQIVIGKRKGRPRKRPSFIDRFSGNDVKQRRESSAANEYAFSLVHTATITDFAVPQQKDRYQILMQVMDKLPDTPLNTKVKERIEKERDYGGEGIKLDVDDGCSFGIL